LKYVILIYFFTLTMSSFVTSAVTWAAPAFLTIWRLSFVFRFFLWTYFRHWWSHGCIHRLLCIWNILLSILLNMMIWLICFLWNFVMYSFISNRIVAFTSAILTIVILNHLRTIGLWIHHVLRLWKLIKALSLIRLAFFFVLLVINIWMIEVLID
jgi:hypothetical protein